MDIFFYYFDKKLDRNAQTNIQTHTIRFQLSVCHKAKSDKWKYTQRQFLVIHQHGLINIKMDRCT